MEPCPENWAEMNLHKNLNRGDPEEAERTILILSQEAGENVSFTHKTWASFDQVLPFQPLCSVRADRPLDLQMTGL